MKMYVLAIPSLGKEFEIRADSEDQAKRYLWNELTEEQKNHVDYIELIDVIEPEIVPANGGSLRGNTMSQVNMTTIRVMKEIGGSFVHKLAELWCIADDFNREVLEKAYKHYFDQYADIAKRLSTL